MKPETKKLISRAYVALECLNNIRMENLRDNLHKACRSEEISHRRFTGGIYHATVSECAALFVVQTIAKYLLHPEKMPSIKDYLWHRRSCYTAAALVLNYREQIEKAWCNLNFADLAALDYCEAIKAAA